MNNRHSVFPFHGKTNISWYYAVYNIVWHFVSAFISDNVFYNQKKIRHDGKTVIYLIYLHMFFIALVLSFRGTKFEAIYPVYENRK